MTLLPLFLLWRWRPARWQCRPVLQAWRLHAGHARRALLKGRRPRLSLRRGGRRLRAGRLRNARLSGARLLHARGLRDAGRFAALLLSSRWLSRRLRAWQRRAARLAGKTVLLAPARLRRRARLPRLLWRARTRRLGALTVLLTGLLVLTTRLTRRWRRGAVWSRHAVLPLRSRLQRLAAVRIGLAWIGATEGALLVNHAAAEILRRVKLAHEPLSRRICCGEIVSGTAARRAPPTPPRIAKPLAPRVSAPSWAPLRSLISIRPTRPSASG